MVIILNNISILIPFRSDHGPREKAFQWVLRFYEKIFPNVEICIGNCNTELFSRSIAINNAAKKATRDIFVIADADMIYNPKSIELSIPLLENNAWVIPYTRVIDISQKSTQNLLATEPVWPINIKLEAIEKQLTTKKGILPRGGLNVVSRTNFEAVGGFDERFLGWGAPDDAFCFAMDTLCGKHIRLKMNLFHLWHEPIKAKGNPNYQSNLALVQQYCRAYGNVRVMKQLIKHSKANGKNSFL